MEKANRENEIPTLNEDEGCMGKSQMACRIVSVIAARMFYFTHTLILIWRVTVIFGKVYWYAALGFILYLIDISIILFKRKGREWKWFQPVVVIFLLIEIPGIWLLELDKVSNVEKEFNKSAILEDFYQEKDDKVNIKVNLAKDTFTLVLEQSMLVVIIIARWLMPKGDLSRDQLSALLLVYLGTAADAVDFFSVLAEKRKLLLRPFFYFPILITWSWSMLQFIFVSTMTDPSKGDNEEMENENEKDENGGATSKKKNKLDSENEKSKEKKTCLGRLYVFLQSEAWGIVVSVFMQDGPYVIVRLICLFYWKITTYTNYFFTLKNALVLLLQLYRVVAVYQQNKKQKEENKRKMEEMREKLKREMNGHAGGFGERGRFRKIQPNSAGKQWRQAWGKTNRGDDFDDF